MKKKFATAAAAQKLPAWNLKKIYPGGIGGKKWQADMLKLRKMSTEMREKYERSVENLDNDEMIDALQRLEKISHLWNHMFVYTYLTQSYDIKNTPLVRATQDALMSVANIPYFFELELAGMPEKELLMKLADPKVAKYAPFIAKTREYINDGLSDGAGLVVYNLRRANTEPLCDLYEALINDIKINHNGKPRGYDETLAILADPSLPVADRLRLKTELGQAMKEKAPTAALILNQMTKDRNDLAQQRGIDRADMIEHGYNDLTPKTIELMMSNVRASYARLSQRFFKWKKESQIGIAPSEVTTLMAGGSSGGHAMSYDDALKVVIDAARKFSPAFAQIIRKTAEAGNFDVELREDKEGGGYCIYSGAEGYPYVLLNFSGTTDDIASGLGHECGHVIHEYIRCKHNGALMSMAPTHICETASIFMETLVFDELLSLQDDELGRRRMLVEKVDAMVTNNLRQIAYFDFELRVQEERKQGEISVERISDIWEDVERDYYGPAAVFDEFDRYRWVRVPHFFKSPFYVYSYAMAQQTVSHLYKAYKDTADNEEARATFVENYKNFLKTAGTQTLYQALRPFDLDTETPEFWQKGLDIIEGYLDQLEKLKPLQQAKKKPAKNPKAA